MTSSGRVPDIQRLLCGVNTCGCLDELSHLTVVCDSRGLCSVCEWSASAQHAVTGGLSVRSSQTRSGLSFWGLATSLCFKSL